MMIAMGMGGLTLDLPALATSDEPDDDVLRLRPTRDIEPLTLVIQPSLDRQCTSHVAGVHDVRYKPASGGGAVRYCQGYGASRRVTGEPTRQQRRAQNRKKSK